VIIGMISACSGSNQESNSADLASLFSKKQSKAEHIREEPNANIYLNHVGYFPATNEFYVFVETNVLLNNDEYEALSSNTDSVIYKEKETLRERVPIAIARENLDLRLLDSLTIYNTDHQLITSAKFSHIEYYQPAVESGFIAVFKPSPGIKIKGSGFYCISPSAQLSLIPPIKEVIDEGITKRIKDEFGIRPTHNPISKHILFPQTISTLSIVTGGASKAPNSISYLTELKDDKITLLNSYKDESVFMDFLPLPLMINDRPVLLVKTGIPETDSTPVYMPFVYEKGAYWMIRKNKIKQELRLR
jgi:hypothetical protein